MTVDASRKKVAKASKKPVLKPKPIKTKINFNNSYWKDKIKNDPPWTSLNRLKSISAKKEVKKTTFRNPGFRLSDIAINTVAILYYLAKYKNATSDILHKKIQKDSHRVLWSVEEKTYKTYGTVLKGKLENFSVSALKKCMEDDARFIIIPLSLRDKLVSHANVLIFDKKTKELERFDPHGRTMREFLPGSMDLAIKKKFSSALNLPRDFVYAIYMGHGPQAWESKGSVCEGDPGGYCLIWTKYYISMRLKHPNMKRETLINKLRETRTENDYPEYFRKFIRNYSDFLNLMTAKYLPKCNQSFLLTYRTEKCYSQIGSVIKGFLKDRKTWTKQITKKLDNVNTS